MQRKHLVLLAALAIALTACGDDSTTDDGTETPMNTADSSMDMTTDSTMDHGDEMTDMSMGEMNMGDPNARPAADVEGADLRSAMFVALDTRPEGYDGVAGTADMAVGEGTTVTIELTGLRPDVQYIAHVHDGACADNGGDHYKFDPDGSDVPPNEIHLAFTADDNGDGFMTAVNENVVDDRARSVVVHPMDLMDNKVACAEF